MYILIIEDDPKKFAQEIKEHLDKGYKEEPDSKVTLRQPDNTEVHAVTLKKEAV